MFAQIKRLGADSLLYAFMNVGTKVIAFIMLPIYTNFLPPAQYGVLGVIDNWTSMLSFLIIFGTDSALAFYYFETKDKDKRLEYVRNVMYFRLFIVAVFALLVIIAGPWISQLLFKNPGYVRLLYISIGVLILDTVYVVVLMVLRFDFKTKTVVIYTVGKMLLVAVLSYVFLKYFVQSPEGILIGRIISSLIIFLMMFAISREYLVPKINFTSLKEIIKYAAPLVPASLAFWVIANASVFFLQSFHSLKEVGIYNAATRLATVITLLTSGVQMAWRPYSMSIKDKENSPDLFAKIYLGLLLIGIFGIMGIATIMPYIIGILGKEYYEAYQYVALISASSFLNFYYLIISSGLFFTKKTTTISVTFGIVAVINTILNIVLIPQFSIWGAVAAYLIAYMIAVVFIFKQSQKVYYVPVSFTKMIFLFVNMIAAVIFINFVQEHELSFLYVLLAWLYLMVIVAISRIDKDFRRKASKEILN
ncbi:lipopolysaccharide biosynthesis protein [Bacillus methanolicus]|uniref:Polysaccharide biosynthesis protein n=1 Tax=Bacillus methanolicus (strain MGA3 / ATCC 53907) TaxID=796606 RepID=I3EB24_BACMM|nr:oligosaccharide flippase family protein [Bacillus methanolicus]AIE61378.1 polysaccharide biosynthesis protein [Bacillus methanolicus MGA3]EIJ83695.1 polysaccharide biosynthesis protein [Bacillus methanolicus MGA3]